MLTVLGPTVLVMLLLPSHENMVTSGYKKNVYGQKKGSLFFLQCGLIENTGSSGCSGVGLKLMTPAWGDGNSMAILSGQDIQGHSDKFH